MDVKEIFDIAIAQKAEHLTDFIEKVDEDIKRFEAQLEERKKDNTNSEGANYYLEGVISGMNQVSHLLKIYNSR